MARRAVLASHGAIVGSCLAATCLLVGCLVAGSSRAASQPDTAQVDALLKSLHDAPDEPSAHAYEGRLRDLWRRAGSPASTMLLDRATREIQSNSPDAAIDDADAVLVLEPEYAEGFTIRATAKLMAGDPVGAIHDAAEALKREPRHIGALMVLSRAAEEHGDVKAAYAAWQKLLELDPKTPDGQARLNALHRKAVGEDI